MWVGRAHSGRNSGTEPRILTWGDGRIRVFYENMTTSRDPGEIDAPEIRKQNLPGRHGLAIHRSVIFIVNVCESSGMGGWWASGAWPQIANFEVKSTVVVG